MTSLRRLLAAAALPLALCAAAFAAGNLQILTQEQGDPQDPIDNLDIQTNVHWAEDDIPVRMLLYTPLGGGVIPFTSNLNGITDERVLLAVSRALQAWNDASVNGAGTGFEYFTTPIPSFFFPQSTELNPTGQVGFDGLNTITWYDTFFIGGSVLGVAPAFVAIRDFDLLDFPQSGFVIPIPFIGDNLGNRFPLVFGVDLDLDGQVDAIVFRTEFRRGEMLDGDIAMSPLFVWKDLPVDPDDIPDAQFEDLVFGDDFDLQTVVFHELGHTTGQSHTYLFDSIMFPAYTVGITNPYERREAFFEDALALGLNYAGPGGLIGGGLGAIAGSLISGAEADGVDPTDFTALPSNPSLLYLFQNPVFIGRLEPGWNFNTLDFGNVATHQPSDLGSVTLLASVFAGNDVAFPISPEIYPSFESWAARVRYNSEFVIPGLPPGDNYVLWTTPNPPFVINAVHDTLAVNEAYPDEYYGGAVPFAFGIGSGLDVNNTTDNLIENFFIQAGVSANGQFSIGLDRGPQALFGHPTPATSFTTVRVIDGGEVLDYTNRLDTFGSTITPVTLNDAGNTAQGVWEVAPGVQIRQSLRILDVAGTVDTANDVLISYELRNVTVGPLEIGLRVLLDTTAGGNDRVPVVADGQEITETTSFTGAAVPTSYRLSNDRFPHVVSEGILRDPLTTTPDRVVFGFFPDLFSTDWTVSGSGATFADPLDPDSDSAVAIFFDPVTVPSGGTVTFSTAYGAFALETAQPETGIAEGSTNQAGEISRFADNASEPELLSVVPGTVTGPLVLITNTGVEPPFNPGGTTEPPASGPGPAFGPPVDIDGGPVDFPNDNDASISMDAGDFDNDGDLDLVFANTLTSGNEPSAQINRLYLNGGFANELPLGNFVDATFGRNGVPDGPPPLGDDQFPIIFDSDPITPGFQGELINEGSAGMRMADFDGDGWLDLYVSNFAASGNFGGAQNRIFMNRVASFAGETFRVWYDETLLREPGVLNAGPFNVTDFSLRSDVGDIDNDGDIDIVVCNANIITTGQTMLIPRAGTEDEPDSLQPAFMNNRILINNGNGVFTDDTLGADNLFGGRPRGLGFELSNAILAGNADRDRLPPLFYDYDPADGSGNQSDLGRNTMVVLAQIGGEQSLDIFSAGSPAGNAEVSTLADGQDQPFINLGDGRFANTLFGDPPWNPTVAEGINFGNYTSGPNYSDHYIDPDITDIYPGFIESIDENGDRVTIRFASQEVGGPFPLVYPPALLGIPDGFPQDEPNTDAEQGPPVLTEINQSPFLIEDPTWGASAADLDNDGDVDLVLANMGVANRIIVNTDGTNVNSQETRFGTNSGLSESFLGRIGFAGTIPEVIGTPVLWAEGQLRLEEAPLQIGGTPALRARAVALGDVDLDGDPDAYFAVDGTGPENSSSPAQNDELLLNDGQGNLTEDVSTTVITNPIPQPTFDVRLADLDNDGDLDAALSIFTNENRYLENFLIDGPATPTTPGDTPLFSDASNRYLLQSFFGAFVPGNPQIFTGTTTCGGFLDADNDGDFDLVIGNGLQALGDNNVLLINAGAPLNPGVTVFKAPHSPFPAPLLSQGVFGVFGEGQSDADQSGSFDAPNASTPTTDILLFDADGDTDFDMLVVNNGFRNSLLLNVDSGEIEPGSFLDQAQSNPFTPNIVSLAGYENSIPDPDFIGDGLFVDVTGLNLPGSGPLAVSVPGGFGRPDALNQTLELSRGAAAGDLDGDGDIDLFVANGIENGTVKNTLLINRGNGVFDAVNDPVDAGRFTPAAANVRNSTDARIFDVDNDGDLDIYVAEGSSGATVVHTLWINDGTAHFTGVDLPVSGINGLEDQVTVELLVGDFDGDGEPTEDINGNGFLDPTEDTDGDGVIDFFDANGNGRHDADYDLILCNINARDLFLANNGSGLFIDQTSTRMPTEDRNSNGILDPGEDSDGNGELGPLIRDTHDAAAADVDLDGDLDVVLAQSASSELGVTDEAITIQLLINDGTGVFTDETDHEVGTTAFSAIGATGAPVTSWNGNSRVAEFGDADGDGDPDLFIGNIGLLGTGVLAGNYNVLLQNRMVGTNLNARSLRNITPGFGGPVVSAVQPPNALASPQEFWATVHGRNFQDGAGAAFGQGIDVLETQTILPNRLRVHLRIRPDAIAGARRVTVTNPDSQTFTTPSGAFFLGDPTGGGAPPTAVSRQSWTMYR